jgi:hypothetical protein
MKVDPLTGGISWARTWGGPDIMTAEGNLDGGSYGEGITIDSSGGIYLRGHTFSFSHEECFHAGGVGGLCSRLFLLKSDPSGNLVWERVWSAPGNGVLLPYGNGVGAGENTMAVDSTENVYATGYVSSDLPYMNGYSGNSTFGSLPGFSSVADTGGMPLSLNYSSVNVNGTVLSASGIENYEVGDDIITIKVGPPTFVSSACGQALNCQITASATVSDVAFLDGNLSFKVAGASGSKGFANVTIPKSAVQGIPTPEVFVNRKPLSKSALVLSTNSTAYELSIGFRFQGVSAVDIVLDQSPSSNPPPSNPLLGRTIILVMVAAAAVGAIAIVSTIAVILAMRRRPQAHLAGEHPKTYPTNGKLLGSP